MASRMFNNSVFNFDGSPVARIIGIKYIVGGVEVDVTEPEDLNKLFEAGQDDLEVTLRCKRLATLTRKAKGSASITWASGETDTLPGIWQVMNVTRGDGSQDAPITSDVKLKPTVPD